MPQREESAKVNFLKNAQEQSKSKGHRALLVGVFGAFDTWPYMDYVCGEIARNGAIALTSIRWYFPRKGRRWIEKDLEEFSPEEERAAL